MPLISMTGFGAASRPWELPDASARVDVEVRSVNARFLELKIRQPFGSRAEQQLRARAQAVLGRGRVELGVFVRRAVTTTGEDDALAVLGLDPKRVAALARAAAEAAAISAREGLELTTSTPVELLRFLHASSKTSGGDAPPAPPEFLDALVDEALTELCSFREREGEALATAIGQLTDELEAHTAALASELPDEVERIRDRLATRLADLCERASVPALDPDRIATEAAVLAARADVAEEMSRLASHVDQIRGVLRAPPSSGEGKTLDFVSQELLREINTIGSKITSSAGMRTVIQAKGTIERIREQVQNVE